MDAQDMAVNHDGDTQGRPLYVATGLALAVHAALMTYCFFTLQAVFEFPDILRKPAPHVLALFRENSAMVISTYYLFALTGFTFIVLVLLINHVLNKGRNPLLTIAAVFGVMTGVVQALGFIRWPFLIPYLAQTVGDPSASDATKETAVVVYHAFNQYAGVAVGETLGYWGEAIWTILISIFMLRHPSFQKALGRIGIVLGIGLFLCTFEGFGGPFAVVGAINAIAHTAWVFWLIALSIVFFRTDPETERAPAMGWKTGLVFAVAFVAAILPAFDIF